jgi:saccharopine dehydrogenase-like NADP-dependent oxidoreductase
VCVKTQANVVISLLPANCHIPVANACIELKKHLVTASYVSSEMALLDDKAKQADVALLCEMGLDPGIGLILFFFFFFFFSTLKQIRILSAAPTDKLVVIAEADTLLVISRLGILHTNLLGCVVDVMTMERFSWK